MKEFRFQLENRPGTLARIALALGEQGINIQAVAGIGAGETGLIRLVTDNPEGTESILKALGIDFEEKEAISLDIPDRPGELGAVLEKLAKEGINVESCYAAVGAEKLILTTDRPPDTKRLLGLG